MFRKLSFGIYRWLSRLLASPLNANIPNSLHRRFKAKCAEEGASMSDLIEKWINEYMSKHGPMRMFLPNDPLVVLITSFGQWSIRTIQININIGSRAR
ncbi:plasmid partition protein ParG [Oleiphilus messinensis]|uniref:plasmid partition protein ParG n=1 Tax=Oleiphilus messinensis TaxID=141451 RepID=UPI000B3B3C71